MEYLKRLYQWFYTRRHTFVLAAILLLAAFLRLYRISDYMTFLGDEGRDLLEVKKILTGNLVFLGPRSSAADFYYGPVYYYFITPFLWLFNYDPAGPAVFVALVGILTVYLVYHIGKEFFGARAGVIASLLYTVSPLVIAYSRSSWNPNPMPFVAIMTLYLSYKAIKQDSLKLFFLSGLGMGIAIQLQYLAIFLGVIEAVFVFLGLFFAKKERILKSYLIKYGLMIAGFLSGWSPFLLFEIKHGFPNISTIVRFMFFENAQITYVSNAGFANNVKLVFIKLSARLLTRFPPPEQVNVNENLNLYLWLSLSLILVIISVIYLLKKKDFLIKSLLFSWLMLGIGLFGFYKKEIYDYFLGFMYPLPFLLVGNLLGDLTGNLTGYKLGLRRNRQINHEKISLSRFKFMGAILAIVIFIFLFVFNLYGNPFRYIPNRQKDQVKKIADFILQKAGDKPYNFALITKGNSDHAYRYFLELSGHPPSELLSFQADPDRKSVTAQLLVICEDIFCQPIGHGLWEIAGFGRAEIAGEWTVSVVKIYKLIHYKDFK